MPYFSGQGKVLLAKRAPNGDALSFREMGDCSGLSFSLATDLLEHKEHESGQRLTDLRFERGKSATMVANVDAWTKDNIALACRAVAGTIAAGSVTGEALPSELVAGDIVKTAKPKISTVVVKDSASTPATLVLDTDYSIHDAAAGLLKILNVGTYVQPFKVDYQNGEVANIPLFTEGLVERWLRFVGLNTVDENKKVMVDLYRVSFDPTRAFNLISDEINIFEMNGGVLYDSTKAADPELGQFGRVVLLDE